MKKINFHSVFLYVMLFYLGFLWGMNITLRRWNKQSKDMYAWLRDVSIKYTECQSQ